MEKIKKRFEETLNDAFIIFFMIILCVLLTDYEDEY